MILTKKNAPRGTRRGKAAKTKSSSRFTAAEKKVMGKLLAKARAAKAAKRKARS